jgi:F-box protein 21
MDRSIVDLPNELLQQIILCLPARNLPNFQRTCRRFRDLVSPLIWRQLCRGTYRYWRPEHRIQDRLQGDIDATDWKALFVERQIVDQRTSRTIDSILASQMGRIDKFREILNHGYDAKDCLLEHCKTDAHAEDVLARRCVVHHH